MMWTAEMAGRRESDAGTRRWWGRRAVAGLVAIACWVAPGPAGAEPVACQRAIARETAKLAQAELAALQSCAAARFAGKLPAATDCTADAAVLAARAKAETDHARKIAKACGGRNKVCNATDTGLDADEALASIGWDQGVCPGFEGGNCANALGSCADVATCLQCVGNAAVVQAVELYAGAGPIAVPRSELNSCQSTIAREAARFFSTRSKALARCEDLVLRGVSPGPCPAGDLQALTKIAHAEATKRAKICKACGGSDGECGTTDDLAPGDIGFVPSCPPLAAGGASCGAPVTSLSELVTCTACVIDFKTDCLDALAVPEHETYPAGCAVRPTPTPTATATPTLTPTPTPTVTPPAGRAAIACERVLVKEAAGLARTRARELGRCETDKQRGKLPLATDCLAASKGGARVAKAERRLADRIGKACGGANRTCSAADTGADADLGPPDFGWSPASCPGFEDAGCVASIADCGDVASCITCVHAAAVDQAIALAFAPDPPADPATVAGACQLEIGRATTSLVLARSVALQKCADAILKGRATGPCPDPGDGKASAAIAKAEDEFLARICKACGGADHLCGGGDDLPAASLGFPATCPDVVGPNGPCGGQLASLADVAQCLACVSGFKNQCLDEIAVPDLGGYDQACRPAVPATPTTTPAGPTPTAPTPTVTPGGICGNNVVEAGEDCDDGNTASCDTCPSNCRLAPVACPTAGRHAQPIRLQRTDGDVLTSALFCFEYPVGTVALPGTGSVPGRITGFPGQTSTNDFNNAARIALLGQQQQTEVNLTLSLDLCVGATPPPVTDFQCSVLSASSSGTSVDPALVDCTAVSP